MATSFGDLKASILRLLVDEVDPDDPLVIGGKTVTASLLEDAVYAGLKAILPWSWKTATYSIATGATELELPGDVYRIEGVYDNSLYTYLNENIITAGLPFASESGNMWIEYPEGHITFLAELTDGGTLYYAAYWSEPKLDEEYIEAPAVVIPGMAFYGASYCLLPRATSSAILRQFNVKVDSGVPTDNPIMDMSNAFMKRFEIEMGRISSRAKGVK
jgi:hypothetical protein